VDTDRVTQINRRLTMALLDTTMRNPGYAEGEVLVPPQWLH
jgi:hypothetical protein